MAWGEVQALLCTSCCAAGRSQPYLHGLPPTLFSRTPHARSPSSWHLLFYLQELRGESTIVFTSSVEATHHLYLLLAALPHLPDRVVEFSSLVAPAERAAHLDAFKSGEAKVRL